MLLVKTIALVFTFGYTSLAEENSNLSEALNFLEETEQQARAVCKETMLATWNYVTNLTESNKQKVMEAEMREMTFWKNTARDALSYSWYGLKDENPLAFRQFEMLAKSKGIEVPDELLNQIQEVVADMTSIYSTAKVCDPRYPCKEPTLELEPDIVKFMSYWVDDNHLKRLWVEWRDATGKKLKKHFLRYVELKNKEAEIYGINDAGELWVSQYRSPTFKEDIEKLWRDIEPFYKQLHAFVRKQLIRYYPKQIKRDGPLPAHLLGSLWSAIWIPLSRILKPFRDVESTSATKSMKEKGITLEQMFQAADEFFTSLGMLPVTDEFWNNSLTVKPTDRKVLCHPSSFDLCDGEDFRILMCAEVTETDFAIIHHEMGHIQYFMQYADIPNMFQGSTNPGFHEAIGDAIALSVARPAHLKKIGFLDYYNDSPEAELNYLMQMALDKIAFLPFGYIMDLWRWSVFNGSATEADMNRKWWEMSLNYQGICPPVKRTEDDLDAATLLHVVADVPYIRYFVSNIIQFQIHKGLCKAAGYEGPLHKCDIYGSKEAGELLSEFMSKGRTIAWEEAMLIISNGETNNMDASGLLEYFEPLIQWLKIQNEGETIGWTSDDPTKCP